MIGDGINDAPGLVTQTPVLLPLVVSKLCSCLWCCLVSENEIASADAVELGRAALAKSDKI